MATETKIKTIDFGVLVYNVPEEHNDGLRLDRRVIGLVRALAQYERKSTSAFLEDMIYIYSKGRGWKVTLEDGFSPKPED